MVAKTYANRLSLARRLVEGDATYADGARERLAHQLAKADVVRATIEPVVYRGEVYNHLWVVPAGYRRAVEVLFAPRDAQSMLRRLGAPL